MLTRNRLEGIRFGPGERLLQAGIAGLHWQPAFSRDGILDGRQEGFDIRLDAGAAGRTLVVRATDALGNVGTGQVLIR
jgi:beta-lactamase class A